jgi:hypothetical protein
MIVWLTAVDLYIVIVERGYEPAAKALTEWR